MLEGYFVFLKETHMSNLFVAMSNALDARVEKLGNTGMVSL
jgi:hypothetical protein